MNVFVAKAHARLDERERAWEILANSIPQWWPIDPAQVAPVELLSDDALLEVVTVDHARTVLRMARGLGAK